MRDALTNLFGPVPGTAIWEEDILRGMLLAFAGYALAGLLFRLVGRRYRSSNPLAYTYMSRLGSALLWAAIPALLICGMFYEDALFNRRWVPWLLTLILWGIMIYAGYFLLRRYPELDRLQRDQREKRRRYVPAPSSLAATPTPAAPVPRPPANRRRRTRRSR